MTFGAIVRTAREERCWSQQRLGLEAGIDPGYLPKIEAHGYQPGRDIVERLAAALELDPLHALVHAGFVPQMQPDEWEAILTDLRAQDRLCPELRAALRGLHGLSGSHLQEADAMLVGLARGFTLAREQRRRAS